MCLESVDFRAGRVWKGRGVMWAGEGEGGGKMCSAKRVRGGSESRSRRHGARRWRWKAVRQGASGDRVNVQYAINKIGSIV